jgi:hypothetical protein
MIKPVLAAGAWLLAISQPLLAQTQADPVREAVQAAMPSAIGRDNTDLVKRILQIRPKAVPLSTSFVPADVSKAVFGRLAATPAPDCQATQTSQKELDTGLCLVESPAGARDDPTAAYTVLAYSKNIDQGQIAVLKRPALAAGGTPVLNPVTLTDDLAYQRALTHFKSLGVDLADVPKPSPTNGRGLPVRTLAAGVVSPTGAKQTYVLGKVVYLERSYPVPGGLGTYPGPVGSPVLAEGAVDSGHAEVTVDDRGFQQASVDDWYSFQMDATVEPGYAKTSADLVDEVTDQLHGHGFQSVGSLSIIFSLRAAMPNPDDPNPPLCAACRVLRPALRVVASHVAPNAIAVVGGPPAPAGVVFEVDLTHQLAPDRVVR